MKTSLYYHNPRRSKSREGLKLLEDKGITLVIKEYLKEPLTTKEIKGLCEKLKAKPNEIVRKREDEYKDLDLGEKKLSEAQWYQIIVDHPVLLERPILVRGDKAVIGRPTERLSEIL